MRIYRLLRRKEEVREGDQYRFNNWPDGTWAIVPNGWWPHGECPKDYPNVTFRRRVKYKPGMRLLKNQPEKTY